VARYLWQQCYSFVVPAAKRYGSRGLKKPAGGPIIASSGMIDAAGRRFRNHQST
jgi:hypothetical protein